MIKKKTKFIYKNPIIQSSQYKTTDNFTSDFGIRIRRFFNIPWRMILKIATKHKIVVEKYPVLNKRQSYIFCGTHSFTEDIISALATFDRSVYVLFGATHQLIYNPMIMALAINGFAYVNRLDDASRKDSVKKLVRILKSGSSIYMFPEGGWNNTENLLVNPLFAGPYKLWQETNCKVVPVITFTEPGDKNVYIRVMDPIDFSGKTKDETLTMLRDVMATEMWDMMEQHASKIERKSIDIHQARMKFMEERRIEYVTDNVWCEDVWDEELTVYKDKRFPLPSDVRLTYRNIKLTPENAKWLVPILKRIEEDEQYDFKRYMHENWDKKVQVWVNKKGKTD